MLVPEENPVFLGLDWFFFLANEHCMLLIVAKGPLIVKKFIHRECFYPRKMTNLGKFGHGINKKFWDRVTTLLEM